MNELVEDGDEIVAIRVIDIDEGGEYPDGLWFLFLTLSFPLCRTDRSGSARRVSRGSADLVGYDIGQE